jgi:hypothetical protein
VLENTNTVFVTKNDPTVDFVQIKDTRAINNNLPAGIFGVVGNTILYTTGGVIETQQRRQIIQVLSLIIDFGYQIQKTEIFYGFQSKLLKRLRLK